jgi:nucleotide-binding universal stress UspA family protein
MGSTIINKDNQKTGGDMGVPFRHAILAVDISEASELMVASASDLAKLGVEKITLVHVAPVPYAGERREFSTDAERGILKVYKKEIEEQGFEAEFIIRSGVHFYPPTELIMTAEKEGADLIVIANRGHSKVQELLLGSTATELLLRSPLPVYLLNVGMDLDEETDERTFSLRKVSEKMLDHVLHATDFSATSNRAFEVVKSLESEGKVGKVSLVHVQGHHALALSDPISLERLTKLNEEMLNEKRDELSDHTREEAQTYLTFGTAAKEIVSIAEEKGATMIVLGSQGKGFIEKFFIGGVSHQVARLSQVPVLLIPAER